MMLAQQVNCQPALLQKQQPPGPQTICKRTKSHLICAYPLKWRFSWLIHEQSTSLETAATGAVKAIRQLSEVWL